MPTIKALKFLTNTQLIELATQVSDPEGFDDSKRQILSPYVKTVLSRVARMTTEELVHLMKVTKEKEEFRTVVEHTVRNLATKVFDLTDEQYLEIAKSIASKPKSIPGTSELLSAFSKEITEIDEMDLLQKPLSFFSILLKYFSGAQIGDGDFYKSIVDILISPQKIDSIPSLQLLRFGVYIRRVRKVAGRGGFGLYAAIESRLWDDLHNNRLTTLPSLLRVFGDLIPAGLGSNKLQLLVEFSLYQQLAKPENRVTSAQVVQLMKDASNYVFKYKPLFVVLQQLIGDSMQMLSLKEVINMIWALGKNNKECDKVMSDLLANVKSRFDRQHCNLRSFTFLLNGCLNAGKTDPETMAQFVAWLKTYIMSPSECHYWVKLLGIIQAAGVHDEPLLRSVLRLASDARNSIKGADMVRLMCAALRVPDALSEFMPVFETVLTAQIKEISPPQLARLAYVAGQIPSTSVAFLSLVESELQTRDLMSLKPSDLAAAAFSLADARRAPFVLHSVPALKHFLDVLRKRVVELASDSEEEEGDTVLQEEQIQFGAEWEMTAAALVQMCWTLAAADFRDAGFWSDKLIRSLESVELNSENPFEVNHWKTTAMAILGKEEFFRSVDSRHFATLLNTLAVIKGVDSAKAVLARFAHAKESITDCEFHRVSPAFLSEISTFYRSQNVEISEGEFDGLLNRIDFRIKPNVCVMCYSANQMVGGRLRAWLEVKQKVLRDQGYVVKEVLETEWEGRGEAARRRLLGIV